MDCEARSPRWSTSLCRHGERFVAVATRVAKNRDMPPIVTRHYAVQSVSAAEISCLYYLQKHVHVLGRASRPLSCKSQRAPTLCDIQADKSVIVVGAGPSGLAAALHLQACGIDVTVLEARDRAGGRVHTVHDKLSAAVDFGAQLCTGMSPDVERMAAPDPSALLARQLGVQLAELSATAPLFDGAPMASCSQRASMCAM